MRGTRGSLLVGLLLGAAALAVFDLVEPKRYAGAWRDPAHLATLKGGGLIAREACMFRFERRGPARMKGRTIGRRCPSRRSGAAYRVTALVATPTRLIWSSYGLDAAGSKVADPAGDVELFVKTGNRSLR